jgi:hypothetical protein
VNPLYTICGWCSLSNRPPAVIVDAEDKRPEATSHGICEQCAAEWMTPEVAE